MNEGRVRWRLLRWQERRRARAPKPSAGASAPAKDQASAREQARRRFEHKTCASCGRVQDRDATVCSGCGARLSARGWQTLERLGLRLPRVASASVLLGLLLVAGYLRVMLAGAELSFSIPPSALLIHGANLAPLTFGGEPWRLATYAFLHVNLLHLAFNLLALAQIGPTIEEVFGRARLFAFFMLTAIVAGLGSALLGVHISAGSSGAVMGLIGVGAGWGQRDGSGIGRGVRNQMVLWAIYTTVFGLAFPVDHAAHWSGFLFGALLGFLTPSSWWRRGGRVTGVLAGLVGAGLALASLLLVMFPPTTPAALPQSALHPMVAEGRTKYLALQDQVCNALWSGRRDLARDPMAQHLYRLIDTQGPALGCATVAYWRGLCGIAARPERPSPPPSTPALRRGLHDRGDWLAAPELAARLEAACAPYRRSLGD
jgi:rhomboid protease GluP